LSALDDYCERAIKDWKGPGLSVAIIRDGKLLTARGYGVCKLGEARPVTKDTVFAIASCTKLFTSASIGKLVAQKQVAWDDPISQHLPLFAGQSKGPISRVTI
jgi:CubicO group peptidase (beta-lactamase class C family)